MMVYTKAARGQFNQTSEAGKVKAAANACRAEKGGGAVRRGLDAEVCGVPGGKHLGILCSYESPLTPVTRVTDYSCAES